MWSTWREGADVVEPMIYELRIASTTPLINYRYHDHGRWRRSADVASTTTEHEKICSCNAPCTALFYSAKRSVVIQPQMLVLSQRQHTSLVEIGKEICDGL